MATKEDGHKRGLQYFGASYAKSSAFGILTPMSDSAAQVELLRRIVIQRLESLQRAGLSILPRRESQEPLLPIAEPISATPSTPPASRFEMRPTNARASVAVAGNASSVTQSSPNLPRPSESEMPRRVTATKESTVTKEVVTTSIPIAANLSLNERILALDELDAKVKMCTRCPECVRNRTQTVFGVGNLKPRILFFGEAPGADEDRQGEPFVGRAGQLLTKIIEACGFKRSDVYIMNVLKCRPPDNRTPTDEETENCRPFFERQMEILQPEYVVCVGASPMRALLRTNKSVGQMRSKFHELGGRKVVITYHPAYLLRNPDAKKFVWEDMKMLLKDMGLEPPSTKASTG